MAVNSAASRFASGQPPCGNACNRDLLQPTTSEVLEDQGFLLFLCFSAFSMLLVDFRLLS